MYQSLIVVDNFYDDPAAIRGEALAFDYRPVEGPKTFPGRNSDQKILPPQLDAVVERLTCEAVVGPKHPKSSHRKVRITLAGEEGRYLVHVDPTRLSWAGVIYLSRPEHCRGGTMFFRHREIGGDRTPLRAEELQAHGFENIGDLMQRDGNDPEKWEHLMTVPMCFNRLILYRPWLWHSAGESFGQGLDDGRLVQLMQFVPGNAL